MSREKDVPQNLIDQAKELLSAYIDGEVTPAERTLVETALRQSPALQIELDSLRQTVQLMQQLHRVPAPRPFTLTPADVGLPQAGFPAKQWPFAAWLKPLMSATAILAALVIVGLFAFSQTANQTSQPELIAFDMAAPQAVQPVAKEEAAQAERAPSLQSVEAEEAVVEEPAEAEIVAEAETMVEAPVVMEQANSAPAPAMEEAAEADAGAQTKAFSAAEAAPPTHVPAPFGAVPPMPPVDGRGGGGGDGAMLEAAPAFEGEMSMGMAVAPMAEAEILEDDGAAKLANIYPEPPPAEEPAIELPEADLAVEAAEIAPAEESLAGQLQATVAAEPAFEVPALTAEPAPAAELASSPAMAETVAPSVEQSSPVRLILMIALVVLLAVVIGVATFVFSKR